MNATFEKYDSNVFMEKIYFPYPRGNCNIFKFHDFSPRA